MSQTYGAGFITVTNTGVSAATGAATARSAIPVASDGNIPRFIRVAGRNECYVRVGTSTVVATTGDILVQPADSIIIQVPSGYTHVAYIQGASAGQVNIVPLENI